MKKQDANAIVSRWLRLPHEGDDKYSRGVVTFVTGSQQYPGAALLGIHAVLATGIGMVRYSGPATVSERVLLRFPEVVCEPGHSDAIVVGSGIAGPLSAEERAEDRARVIDALAEPGIHIVDAGALELVEPLSPSALLTPHQGELDALSRRLGLEPNQERKGQAQSVAATLGACVLAKGAHTVVVAPQGESWALPLASAWLATAGTGDALAGILGALAASNAATLRAKPELMGELAAAGALLHARAAELASERAGGGAFRVTQLCDVLPEVVGAVLTEVE